MPRDQRTETVKRKRLGKWLFVLQHIGVGGVVPNHGPHIRKVMLSQGEEGWHLHLTVKTLHTWNGYRNAKFEVAFHPSRQRREHLHAKYTEGKR